MSSIKRILSVCAVLLYIGSLLILVFDVFKIPANAGSEYAVDKLFYYSTNIIFWICTPYILSFVFKRIIWKREFNKFVGTKAIGLIEDISIVAIYFVAFFILFIKLFRLEISFGLILLLIIIIVLAVYLRPSFLKLSKGSFVQSARPFKIGDWISLLNQEGKSLLVGKVINFDHKSVQLRTEKGTKLILPNSLLTNYVIENFQAIEKEVQFSVPMYLSPKVSSERAKRILAAAVKHGLSSFHNLNINSVNVLIVNVTKESIEYKVNYSFIPWEPFSPERVKDIVLTNIINHLAKAGIAFDHDKDHNILEQVEIFTDLNRKELDELSESAGEIQFAAGEVIIQQGEEGSSMFVLQEGLLDVMIKAENKEDLKVGMITPGQFFGEMSLLTGEARSATIISATDSIVLEIKKDAMKKLLNKKPELINSFGEIIAERQSSNLKKMDDYLKRKDSFVQKFVSKVKSFFNL